MNSRNRELIHISEPAGTGKIFVERTREQKRRGRNDSLHCYSGIAAMNYPEGKPAHRAFEYPQKKTQGAWKNSMRRFLQFRTSRPVMIYRYGMFANKYLANFQAVEEMLRKIWVQPDIPCAKVLS